MDHSVVQSSSHVSQINWPINPLAKAIALSFGLLLSACNNESVSLEQATEQEKATESVKQEQKEPLKSDKKVAVTEHLMEDRLSISAESASALGTYGAAPLERRHKLVKPKPIPMKPSKAKLMPASSLRSLQPYAVEPLDREQYQHLDSNSVKLVSEAPVSTFSIDVDTASYTNVRRMLNQGRLPRHDAVRLEEFVNYFDYDYPQAQLEKAPFSIDTEVSVAPWDEQRQLFRIGLQAYEPEPAELLPVNLVFLIDVSGSMSSANKLPLLKKSFAMLVDKMRAKDRVSIVVYAGAAGQVLAPTAGNEKRTIMAALERLEAGGSTNGGAGINLAYQLAESAFIKEGTNRIILASDGDVNVGTSNIEALKDLIKEKRKTGIGFSTLGFGSGNYNDHLMEQLANVGNGSAAYIDSLKEAQKVLVEQMSATLHNIAKDVKIQIEFNPQQVAEYRLLGYENRQLKREDFNNDKVDAGEIGAGHQVTALYELVLKGDKSQIDPLRYAKASNVESGANSDELAFVRLRYKPVKGSESKLLEQAVYAKDRIQDFSQASLNMRFASSVAAFAQQLRGGEHLGDYGYQQILEQAIAAKGLDPYGYRAEFTQLIRLAMQYSKEASSTQALQK